MVSLDFEGRGHLLRSHGWPCYWKMECWRSGDRRLCRLAIVSRVRPLPLEDQPGGHRQRVCIRAGIYILTTETFDTIRIEIVATSVTLEQENLTSPIKLSFRTIQKVPLEMGTSLSDSFSTVLWRDYLIGSFVKARALPRTCGIFLWSMRENSILYFEVCHSFFPPPGALNPILRQMGFSPWCIKVLDDLLFISCGISRSHTDWSHGYRCIHIPTLVISAQLPEGSLSLTENAFAMLLPKCIMESCTTGPPYSPHTVIYSIPACPPTHPTYCFIVKGFPAQSQGVEWEVIEVEIDLSIPGPIKIFSRVSRHYTLRHLTYISNDIDDDLLLYRTLGHGVLPRASISVRLMQVGKPSKVRVARLGGVDNLRLTGLSVDKDAGYVIISAAKYWPRTLHHYSFILWLDERKPGNIVYSRTKELISSWSRRLLQRF